MPFGDYENSRNLGEPINLYFFRYGTTPNAYYAYTDWEQSYTYQGVIYEPIPIERSDFQTSGTLDKTALKVNTPINTRIADLYKKYPPGQPITLVVRQGHVNDPTGDFLVIWTGRVLSCDRQGRNAEFSCEPIHMGMRRSGLRRMYQFGCPHALYSLDCGANRAAATTEHVIVNLTETRITLTDGWSGLVPPAKYIGGYVEWEVSRGIEQRTILRVSDLKTLHLAGPTTGLQGGDTISVVLGCNHQAGVADEFGDCKNLHNNVLNYGGQPWIPLKNPINTNPHN